ncbi:MAG: hypothetical protein AB8E15_05135 [Bdellovibrionales bacterium]
MKRFFTPSERTRSSTNPQPVKSKMTGVRRSKYLVLLKNLVGAPVPFLWMAFAFSLSFPIDIHSSIAWGITGFSFLYIAIDRFSAAPEFRFFSSGFEIPFFLVLLFGGIANLHLGNDFFSGDLSQFWLPFIFLCYGMSYSLNLFPGLNRIFHCLSIGLFFSAILFLGYQQQLLQSQLYAVYQALDTTNFSWPISLSLGALFCASYFIYKRNRMTLGFFVFVALFAILQSSTLSTSNLVFFISPIIALLLYVFFITKNFIKNIAIWGLGLVLMILAIQYLNPPFYDNNIMGYQLISETEKEFWRSEFNDFSEHIWFGKTNSLVETIPGLKSGQKNFFLHLLAQKGMFPFVCYLSLLLFFIFMNIRLLNDIPITHNWHKVFAMFSLASMAYLLLASMQWTLFASSQSFHWMIFLFASLSYIVESYGRNIVPDDQSI